MKTKLTSLTLALVIACAPIARASVPRSINYQGVVQVDGSDFSGAGHFKFALVYTPIRGIGDVTLWSHDGTSIAGSEPSSSVKLSVSAGLFTVGLGDTAVPNMTEPIAAADVSGQDVRLRVWFSDQINGFSVLSPDRPLRSVPYALQAASLVGGVGTIDGSQIIDDSVDSAQIADAISLLELDLGSLSSDGSLRLLGRHTGGGIVPPGQEYERVKLYADAPGTLVPNPTLGGGIDLFDQSETRRVSLRADGALISLTESDGNTGLFLRGDTLSGGGAMSIFQDDGNTSIQLSGQQSATSGGVLSVHDSTGQRSVRLLGQQSASSGGVLSVYDSGGNERVKALGVNGTLRLFDEGATQTTLLATGDDGEIVALDSIGIADSVGDALLRASLAKNSEGGAVRTRRSDGQLSTFLATEGSGGGILHLHDASGDVTAELQAANGASSGARLQLREADGSLSVRIGAQGSGGGGFISLRDGAGNTVIELDASENGSAVTRTQVLEITGGSDLSEKFEIAPFEQAGTPPEPGSLVCIDPDNPGALMPSSRAYDRRVAGVISGAGGVNPGMLMGQRGSIADGAHPVALTGRVYCLVDAGFGAIEPGDLITTSDTPGHGMRADDHAQSAGAVIGKAMTRLESGRGLVLVLVSLQ